MKDDATATAFRDRLALEMRSRNFRVPDDYAERFVPFTAAQWCPHVDALTTAIEAALLSAGPTVNR
jgi:hypothetical protein